MFPEQLEKLFDTVDGAGDNLLILPHNNPDPDAIGSAIALQHLLKEGTGIKANIVYRGLIGRAENKTLIKYLGNPLTRFAERDSQPDTSFALVDTQPGAGNNCLPETSNLSIVIDHHPWREGSTRANFIDVRPEVGSTCGIMVEYLRLADLKPETPLATALFYGIKTDTMGLGRGTSPTDTSAICYLLPLIDLKALMEIERAKVPVDYFKSFANTLQTARIYGDVVIAFIGDMNYPDMAAEMADFLLRMKGSRWVICMGVHKNRLILSIRTNNARGAGHLVQAVVGKRGIAGGHGAMAGGQVPLSKGDEGKQIANELIQAILRYLNIPDGAESKTLV